MRHKSLAGWIRRHRQSIDEVIRGNDIWGRLDDEERRLWVLNDEGLYLWAKSDGTGI